MAIQSRYDDKGKLTITVTGRLDFKVHKEFRQAYEQCPAQPKEIVVDLRGTEYMDSSGLGMLLLLRDHFGAERSAIRITGASEELAKVLSIANFDKLFKLD